MGRRQTWMTLGLSAGLAVACSPRDPQGSTSVDGTSAGTTAGDASATTTGEDTSTKASTTSGTDSSGGSDEGSSSTGTNLDCPAGDELPDPAPRWLSPYQTDIVSRLSGAQPLWDDDTFVLAERSTPQNRAMAAQFIGEQLEALGLETSNHDYAEAARNVYSVLPATEDEAPYLVVGAHFDTVPGSPGANDNATGVALVLGLARYLQELPCRNRNIIFVLFDEEEIGLVGSWHFAELLSTQRFDVEAAHTIDQMGWDDDGDRAIEIERPDEGLLEFYQAAAAQLGESRPLTPTQTGFTDHVSFRDWGFAAVGLTEEFVSGDTTPHYHMASDTFETVDLDYLASTTRLANHAFALALTSP